MAIGQTKNKTGEQHIGNALIGRTGDIGLIPDTGKTSAILGECLR